MRHQPRRTLPICAATAILIAACGNDATAPGEDVHTPDGVSDTLAPDGDTTPSCTSTCTEEGARSCDDDAVLICVDANDDGCLAWTELLTCGEGTTCVEGTCGVACPDAPCNAAGARRCEGTAVATCGDSNGDGCLDWGAVSPCEDGLVCANGFCALSCVDTCTAVGARKCEAGAVVTCDDHDEDGCLEWGAATACGAGETCSSGFCGTTCTDECTSVGATRCDAGGVATCGQFDSDECLEWGTVVACDAGETCSNGACATTCTSECSTLGARSCDGNRTRVCEDRDGDGCLRWSSPVPCGDGLVCASGQCAATCSNECTVVGARACDLGGRVITCGDHDGDGCLEWSDGVSCGENLVCSAGNCAVSCTSTCSAVGLRQCSAGTASSYEICDDHNGNGCLEWGTPSSCGGSLVCSAGQCESTCTNTCAVAGVATCDGNAVRTCGDHNGNGCLELGTAVSCDPTEICQGGICEALEPPAKVIINEVVVDSPGWPDLDTFLELHGPPGTDLSGYTVVGVNGNGGADYVTITLSGTIKSDGLFVITHPQAKPSIADMSDFESSGVDFQNGPDSIQVRFGGVVLDALGYGNFGPNDVFAGEGSPAPRMGVDEALARDADHTDTDDNAADFTLTMDQTPGRINAPSSAPPVARVTCPTGVQVGQSRLVDGSASSDPEGAIVNWRFDFGDGTPAVSGAQAAVSHTWSAAGSFIVTLTVTSDSGLSHAATCQVAVADGTGPVVSLVRPVDQLQVTQGDTVRLLADARAAPGRTITAVTFWADGAQIASDDVAPFEATWTVPAATATGATIILEARAEDSAGGLGVSQARILRVENDPPVAAFTATVTGALQVTADASASYDTETPAEALEVRWDWDDDGVWDTAYSTTRRVTHTFSSTGVKTIRLQVRDAAGQTATATRSVDLALLQTVSGTVETTTWAGTVIVTGQVIVASGHTLSIAPGTDVLFTAIDQNNNGIGDYGIRADGALLVQGTAADPVVFTTYGTQAKAPRDWSNITLRGAGSVVNHAVIEYADIGLIIESDAQVADVSIRSCFHGVRFALSGAGSLIERADIRDHVSHGVVGIHSHAGVIAESTVARNGGNGVYITADAVIDIRDSVIRDNALVGLEFFARGRGAVTRNIITANAYEGLRLVTALQSSTGLGPVVHHNNIYGNATVGARLVESVDLTVSSDGPSTGPRTSPAWTAPEGTTIELVYFSFTDDEPSSESRVQGFVRDGTSTTDYVSLNLPSTYWWDLTSRPDVTSVRARITDTSTSRGGTASIRHIAYTMPGAVAEASVVTGVPVDLRFNYWGTFESPLPVISAGPPDRYNIQGFRGVAYDSSWTRAPWVGGEVLEEDTVWSGDIFVSGVLETASGRSLTLDAGTTVRFAPVDQDGDGVGDYGLRVRGLFTLNGTSAARIVFTSLASSPAPGDWDRVTAHQAVNAQHAEFAFGTDGLEVRTSADYTLADIESHDHLRAGLRLMFTRHGTAERLTSHSNGTSGLELNTVSASEFALSHVVCRDNALHGLAATSVAAGVTLTDSVFTNNGGIGLALDRASLAVSHSEISYNREGVRFYRASAASLTASDITFNDGAGIVLLSGESETPSPLVNGNNIYGNSVEHSSVVDAVSIVAATSGSSAGTFNSDLWTAPGDAAIHAFEAEYSEADVSGGDRINGFVLDQDDEALLARATPRARDFFSGWSHLVIGLRARVTRTVDSSIRTGTMTITHVFHEGGTEPTELAAMMRVNTADVTGNYWGVFPDVGERMTMNRTNAVNFQGFQFGPISGTGPR